VSYQEPYGGVQPDQLVSPPEEPGQGSKALVAVLVSVLVLVLCGGGVAVLYLIGAKDRTPRSNSPAAAATTRGANPSPSPSRGTDPTAITKGQCVVNEGTQDVPVLRVVACGSGTYRVVERFDGTIDVARCNAVAGSDFHYFYDTTPNTLDFVLCLKSL
jgi:hypothetical protein